MALPIKYNIRNVLIRWRVTLATVAGIALVVAVWVSMQSMAAGLEASSSNTGDPRNLMIVRKGSTAESSSQITREQFKVIPYLAGIVRDEKGQPLISADVIVLIAQPRRDGTGEANVLMRGISPKGLGLRPQVSLVEGRWFIPGKREVVVSQSLAKRFEHFDIGGRFKTAGKELTIVGIMNGGSSAFDSEAWMDADEARSIFDRENYSSILARVESPAAGKALTLKIESDKRLPLHALPEVEYYTAQTTTALPFKILAYVLGTAMSIGAVFAAMNTMYASVGARTREIGTLRVLGFRRRSILISFLLEGAFLALIGGVVGCAISAGIYVFLRDHPIGTMSFDSFSETVFHFRVTPFIMLKGLIFSVIVGMLGSLFPAIRASRLPVIAALKSL